MPEIIFESEWLKANVNVSEGDNVKFLDKGHKDPDGRWVFSVGVIKKGSEEVAYSKKFSLNKVNFNALSELFGSTNSDSWEGREAVVRIGVTENPKTGKPVDTVRFSEDVPAEGTDEDPSGRGADEDPPGRGADE